MKSRRDSEHPNNVQSTTYNPIYGLNVYPDNSKTRQMNHYKRQDSGVNNVLLSGRTQNIWLYRRHYSCVPFSN